MEAASKKATGARKTKASRVAQDKAADGDTSTEGKVDAERKAVGRRGGCRVD